MIFNILILAFHKKFMTLDILNPLFYIVKFPFNMVHPLEYGLVWLKQAGILTTYIQHKEIN
jgi:hypothetical protein